MIKLSNISLRYPIMGLRSHSLQAALYSKVGGILGGGGKGEVNIRYVEALRNISLDIKDKQRLGIIGHNGAGKTTLLRILSGVYPPTSGVIETHGKISALTDFTLGMDPDVTGLKNIIFRLIFMGYTFADAQKAVDEIVDFSELGEFIHYPMRTYSTGMFLRLAFAISTHFTPDILILDEVIGAGDEGFKAKAIGRLNELVQKSRIVILSTHDLGSLETYCTDAIHMAHGEILHRGTPQEIIKDYRAYVAQH